MKVRRWTTRGVLGVAAAVSLAAVPVIAHHSSAPFYDSTKKVEAQGTVTKFLFKNPHSFLYFEQDEGGKKIASLPLLPGEDVALLPGPDHVEMFRVEKVRALR